MTKGVITVEEDTPPEEAARIMMDDKVGGLPVVRDGKWVGIIAESELFRISLELLAARERKVRIGLLVPEEKGVLASVSGRIAKLGGISSVWVPSWARTPLTD